MKSFKVTFISHMHQRCTNNFFKVRHSIVPQSGAEIETFEGGGAEPPKIILRGGGAI